jgi:hypothetical protein
MNLLINLKGYDDSSTTPSQGFVQNLQYIGIEISEQIITETTITPGNSKTIFSVAPVDAKKIVYIEVDKECDIIVNGVTESTLKPVVIRDSVKKGVFLKISSIETLEIDNTGTEDLKIYCIAVK